MPNSQTDSKKQKSKARQIFFWSLLLAGLVLILIGLIRFGNLFAFLLVFPWFVSKLNGVGVNIWLARFLAVPIVFFIVLAFAWILSFNKEKRKKGYILGAVLLMAWFATLFLMTKDFNFDPTGAPLKYFAMTPYGYKEVPKDSYDTTFGTKGVPVTTEMAISKVIKEKGLPKVQKVTPSQDSAFFTPYGKPLVWYYQYPNGKIDLFATPGKHPQFNTELNPITPAIVEEIFKQLGGSEAVVTYGKESDSKIIAPKLDALRKLRDTLEKSRIKD